MEGFEFEPIDNSRGCVHTFKYSPSVEVLVWYKTDFNFRF